MPSFVGIDYGTRRIGLAISGADARVAMPLTTVAGRGDPSKDAAAVLDGVRDHDVDVFVVGLPLNMDGSEGGQAKLSRTFGDALARHSKKPVAYQDERLSSHAADGLARDAGLSAAAGRRVQDELAAQILLQAYLNTQPQ